MKTGTVTVKACKTDSVFQTFAVRQNADGEIEYLHKQMLEWCSLPAEWSSEIIWN